MQSKYVMLFIAFLAAHAHAQVPVQKSPLIPVPNYPGLNCWYNTEKQLTGADAARPTAGVGFIVLTGRGGDYAWAYTVSAPNGQSCPKKLTDVPHSAPRNLLTCTYDAQKNLTGAEQAAPGAVAFKITRTGQSGDRVWTYTKADRDFKACPAVVPEP